MIVNQEQACNLFHTNNSHRFAWAVYVSLLVATLEYLGADDCCFKARIPFLLDT